MLRPSVNRLSKHLQALVGERNPFTSPQRLHAAGQYILQRFREARLDTREQEVRFEGAPYHNILGLKKGAAKADEIFVLGAHYDTVEGSPGADDNAAAVAALLEIARYLEPVPLNASLMFAGFTLEEHGFVGSNLFVEQLRQQNVPVRGMIALEMLGFRNPQPGSQRYPPYVDASRYPDTGDFIAVVGNEPSQDLTLSLVKAMRQTVPRLPVEYLILPGRGDAFEEVRLSDHSPFWDNNHQAVMITDTAFFRNPHYHAATDTLDTLDIGFVRDIASAVAGFLESHLS
ncbi:MAG: M28 family peptidase [Nitrospinales bacterium]